MINFANSFYKLGIVCALVFILVTPEVSDWWTIAAFWFFYVPELASGNKWK